MESDYQQFNLTEIKLEVTYRCNLRCIHCSSNAGPDGCEMSLEKALSILEEASEMGIKEVAFSGGEPLLWSGITKAVEFCQHKRLATALYTCGNIQDETILVELRKNGLQRIIFSLYGDDDESHNSITQTEGSFKRTFQMLEVARQVGLNTEFHFVPFNINYVRLLGILKLANAKGVSQISVLRLVPHGRGAKLLSLLLSKEQNLELKSIIESNSGAVNIRTGSPYNFLLINDSPRCGAGIDRLTISPDLIIYPCDAFKQVKPTEIAGTDDFSRLDRWSLRECWEQSPYLKTVRKYLTTPFEAPCNDCANLRKCLSGCLAQKYITNRKLIKAPDPMCLFKYPPSRAQAARG